MKFLLHDRDTKFSEHFRRLIRDGGVRPVALSARSPVLNGFVERWIRTVKDECLGKLISFGRSSVERALKAYVEHYHAERNHQGIGNVIPNPRALDRVGGVSEQVEGEGPWKDYLAFMFGEQDEYLDPTGTELITHSAVD